MAVQEEVPVEQWLGNGVTTSFAYAFTVEDPATLIVRGLLNDIETLFVFGVDYTLTGVGTASGSVVFAVAPASGMVLTAYRDTPVERISEYQYVGDFQSPAVNLDFDLPLKIVQEVIAGGKPIGNTVHGPAGETFPTLPPASARKGMLLGFDTVTGGLVLVASAVGSALDLATQYASSVGASLLGFIQSGVGSVLRTVQSKLRESVTPGDKAAVGDGVADDTTALQNVMTGAYGFLPKVTGHKVTALTVAASTFLQGSGRQAPINVSGTGGLSINGSNVYLRGLYLNGPGSAQLAYAGAASVSNVRFDAVEFASDITSAPNGHGVQTNQIGADNWGLFGCVMNVYDFGWLAQNSTASAGPKGHAIIGNEITTQVGDNVEFNTPGTGAVLTTAAQYVRVIGNDLKVAAGSGTAAGFGIGLAHVDGAVVVGNVGRRAWLEGMHFEDGCRNVTIVGNVIKNCLSDGIRHLINGPGANDSQTRALSFIGNHLEAASIVTGAAGIRIVFNANGTPWGSTLLGNSVRNFDVGLWLGGNASHKADGNVIDACNIAMRVDLGNDVNTRVDGTNLVRGTVAALLDVNNAIGAMLSVGKFICDTKPTALITRSGGSTTRPGASIDGFVWPQTNVLGAGTTWCTVFAAAATCRFRGTFMARARDNAGIANNAWYSADVFWDGTTLTISNPHIENNAALAMAGPPAVRVSGGNFQVGLFHAAGITVRLDIDFDGVYYA